MSFAVAFSTSSSLASVALITLEGNLIWGGSREAPHKASGACIELLQKGLVASRLDLASASLFLADLGPGSFTGVRVGVTMAKTLAFTNQVQAGGIDAFELIAPGQVCYCPSRKREVFVRVPGEEIVRSETAPSGAVGYGLTDRTDVFPSASRFAGLLDKVERMRPEELVPRYLTEPSISTPKRAYGLPGAAGG